MKNLMKFWTLTIALIVMVGAGCKKISEGGKMTIRMTDAPALYDEVNVDIREVSVHYTDSTMASGGWVKLNTNAGIYNLLDLQDDISVIIAGDSLLPIGRIDQMRILLGDSNYLVKDSVAFDLKVPSGTQTGLKLNINTEIKTNNDVDVLVDFDASKSIVVQGNGKFLLKPHILVKSVVEN